MSAVPGSGMWVFASERAGEQRVSEELSEPVSE